MSAVLRSRVPAAASTVEARAAWRRLLRSASALYRPAGRFACEAVAGKLRFDPVFRHVLEHGLIESGDRVLDIGCGRGLLMSLLRSAEAVAADGIWPNAWPAVPIDLRLTGIDSMPGDVALARAALREHAEVICGDMRQTPLPPADVAVLLDVLHYVDLQAQDRLLERVRQALGPGGRLLLRVGDASRAGAFRNSRWVDSLVLLWRGQRRLPIVGRPLADWRLRLESLGFDVEVRPMSRGTPFANLLLIGRVGTAAAPFADRFVDPSAVPQETLLR